jgi:hypothetical protein
MADDETLRSVLRSKSADDLEHISSRPNLPRRTLELIAEERKRRAHRLLHDTQVISAADVAAAAVPRVAAARPVARKPAWFSWKWLAVAIVVSVAMRTDLVRELIAELALDRPKPVGGYLGELEGMNRSAKVSGIVDTTTALVWLLFVVDFVFRIVYRVRWY